MNKVSKTILQGFKIGHYGRRRCAVCKNYFYYAKNTRGGHRPSGLRSIKCTTCSSLCSRNNYYSR